MQKVLLLERIEQKDYITCSHCYKTSSYALKLGNEVGLNEEELALLEISASLHDVGKLNVPDVILQKPSVLTKKEYDIIKKHSAWGAEIVEQVFIEEKAVPLSKIIRHHHERYDGKGYPDRLKGDKIPLLSQIISVADAFDAMTSDRNYRKAMATEKAVSILKNERGKQFQSGLVDVFIKLVNPNLNGMSFAK